MTATDGPALQVIAQRRLDVTGHRRLTVGAAQLGGRWLDVPARMGRLVQAAQLAAGQGCDVLAFPESYLSGYPFWLPRTNGASFDDPDQKACYAHYLDAAVEVGGEIDAELAELAADLRLSLVVGISERGRAAASGSVFCTVLTYSPTAGLVGHHRKLVPTYDERLVWAPGDGAGLRAHQVGNARLGSLACWENWMPQARQALYAGGEQVHVSVWPGSSGLTGDITRFLAGEGRVFSLAASGLLRSSDVPDDFPLAEQLRANSAAMPFNGGSALAGPDGAWILEPVTGTEGLLIADLDLAQVDEERLTFDPTGHYSRPDVFSTAVDRRRRHAVTFRDEPRAPAHGTP